MEKTVKKAKIEENEEDERDEDNMSQDEEENDESDFMSSVHHPLSQISLHSNDFAKMEEILKTPLARDKKLIIGQLDNGFKYEILPNNTPPNVVEVYLEVHAGSKDELDDEQGIAHFVEHAVFLGTKKYPTADTIRTVLAQWGMSFGPDANAFTDFPQTVYTFHAPVSQASDQKKDLLQVVEVLYELAFEALLLPEPINVERGAVISELKNCNTADYRVEYQRFQQVHAKNVLSARFPIGKEEQLKKFSADDIRKFYTKHYTVDNMTLHVVGAIDTAVALEVIKDIFAKIPEPSSPLIPRVIIKQTPPSELLCVYQNELITQFGLNINIISPVIPLRTLKQVREEMILSLLELALDTRIYALEQQANPPFTGISWEIYDTAREHSRCSIFSVNSHILEWKEAVTAGIQELQRLVLFGITEEELHEHLGSLLKDAHQAAEQNETQESSDLVEYIIDDFNLNNVAIDRKQDYRYQMKVAGTITVKDVNLEIKRQFGWLSDLATKPLDTLPYASIFVAAPVKHKKKPIKISQEEVLKLLVEAVKNVQPQTDKHMPDELIEASEIDEKIKKYQPTFVAPTDKSRPNDELLERTPTKIFDKETGITLRKLSNGITLQHKKTTFEAKHVTIDVVARGGKSIEPEDKFGSVQLGWPTFIGGGAGNFGPEEISKYCTFHGLSLMSGIGSETSWVSVNCSVSHNGLRKAMSIIHLFFTSPCFDKKTFERSKKLYKIDCDKSEKEVDVLATENIMKILHDPLDTRTILPKKADYNKVTWEMAKEAVQRQLASNNLEVVILGDFQDTEEVENLFLRYFGSIPPTPSPFDSIKLKQFSITKTPKYISGTIEDEADRSVMIMATKAVARWNKLQAPTKNPLSSQPLYCSRTTYILTKLISAKLFSIVREKLGLTYEISADFYQYDFYNTSLFFINVTPFTDKIEQTKEAVLEVLRDIKTKKFTQAELDEEIVPQTHAITEALNTNGYWVGLMSYLQHPEVPKDFDCIRKIAEFYSALTLEDISYAIDHFLDLDTLAISVASTTKPTKE